MAPAIKAHIRRESITNWIINCAINGTLAWFLLSGNESLQWWGPHGFAKDMMVTAVLLTFIVSLIMIMMHRKKVGSGKLPALQLDNSRRLHVLIARMPQSVIASALIFVAIALLLFLPIVFVLFSVLGIESLSVLHYALFKGAWAGTLAAVMVVPMIMLGMRAPQ